MRFPFARAETKYSSFVKPLNTRRMADINVWTKKKNFIIPSPTLPPANKSFFMMARKLPKLEASLLLLPGKFPSGMQEQQSEIAPLPLSLEKKGKSFSVFGGGGRVLLSLISSLEISPSPFTTFEDEGGAGAEKRRRKKQERGIFQRQRRLPILTFSKFLEKIFLHYVWCITVFQMCFSVLIVTLTSLYFLLVT